MIKLEHLSSIFIPFLEQLYDQTRKSNIPMQSFLNLKIWYICVSFSLYS